MKLTAKIDRKTDTLIMYVDGHRVLEATVSDRDPHDSSVDAAVHVTPYYESWKDGNGTWRYRYRARVSFVGAVRVEVDPPEAVA